MIVELHATKAYGTPRIEIEISDIIDILENK
jgi:hypothetical protein